MSVDDDSKQERRVAAMTDEMARTLRRLHSVSIAMMRADAAWEAYHREMTKVVESGQSDEELIAPLMRQAGRVENNDFLRASGHLTVWLALLYVVIEGWRKWRFFDSELDPLLESPIVEELKKYRHAIFHANDFDHRNVLEFEANEARRNWTSNVGNALRQAIRDWNVNLRDRMGEYLLRSPPLSSDGGVTAG
jgi:hypothetical protein